MEKDGGSAFPREQGTADHYTREPGMSLRDYFAGQALASLAADGALRANKSQAQEIGITESKMLALTAYEIADAMLAERIK